MGRAKIGVVGMMVVSWRVMGWLAEEEATGKGWVGQGAHNVSEGRRTRKGWALTT